MGKLLNIYWNLMRGPLPTVSAAVVAASLFVIGLLCLAVLLPQVVSVALLVAAGYGLALLTLAILLISRLMAKLNDLRYLVSFEAGLRRAGYALTDFFSEGAAGNPSLQLVLLKCLQLYRPRRILELGSGQTTKLFASYYHANPGTSVVTLEQDEAWARRVLPEITVAGKSHDYRVCPLEERAFLAADESGLIQTKSYKGIAEAATERFGLILVDGPDLGGKGTAFTPYSRAGILEFVPTILDDCWVVVFDDAERYGEKMTIRTFQSILRKHNRPFVRFDVHGTKTQSVFCSPGLSFLQSV